MNHRSSRRAARRVAAAGACALLLVSCATNPVTGKSQFTLFTEAEEIELGLAADRETLPTFGEYLDDPALTAYVSDLGLRMAAQSERPELPWSFRVIDDETVNAFALPGGRIYVTRGLLAHLGRESELAGVLGHEIGHVTARHAIYGMSRDLALSAALVTGLVLLEAEDAELYAEIGLGLLFLKFSRNQERQADELATRYAPRVGLDPYGAVDALRILSQVSAAQQEGWFPTWLSTHPDPERRWQRLAAEGGLSPLADPAAVRADRERYVGRLDGLVYGPDPRSGMLRDPLYLHPRDGFQVAFPQGWTIEREGQTVAATNPAEDAYLMLLRGPEATPEEAEEALVAELGLTAGDAWSESLGGFRARLAGFTVALEDETAQGVAAFVAVGTGVVTLLAFSAEPDWPGRRQLLLGALRSFRRLDDPQAAAARPARLRIVTAERATTLRRLAAERSPGTDLETLALLNDLGPDEPIEPGRRIKLVEPAP